jgi:glycosyltransferase involved in cell wall biosynthesis
MTKPFKLKESLSIIIPAYNEAGNIERVVKETLRDAKKVSNKFEIIVINDGSSDKTAEIINHIAGNNKKVRPIHHKTNRGLANAWKTGIRYSKNDLILYIEGDGQQPFADQIDLLIKLENADLVLGTRSYRFDYTIFRKSLSYGYLFLTWLLFGLKYKDVGWSQAYRRKIFNKIQIKSVTPFFDTEVVIKAKNNGFKIAEATSFYRSRKKGRTSLGNIKTAFSMFKEMVKMRLGLL